MRRELVLLREMRDAAVAIRDIGGEEVDAVTVAVGADAVGGLGAAGVGVAGAQADWQLVSGSRLTVHLACS